MNSISSLQLFNIFRFCSTLLTGILLAKTGLPTEDIAIYELLLFLISIVSFFWIMGGQTALLQYFPKLEGALQKQVLFNIFLLFVVFSFLSATFLWVCKDLFSKYFNQGDALPYLDLICWYIALNTPTFLIHIYYLLLEKFDKLIRWGVFTFSLQLIAIVLPIFLGYSLVETFRALLFVAGCRIVWLLYILYKNAAFQINVNLIKNYLWLAFPLAIQIFIGHSADYVDGLIVQANMVDRKQFAIFRWGAKELPISLLLVGAVVMAMIPQVTKNQGVGLQILKQKTEELCRWLYPLSMVLMLVSPILFPLAYNVDAFESAKIFNIYLLILSSRILMPQIILMSQQKNYLLVVSALIEIVVNVVLSLFWVQYFGLVGIAFASVVAYMIDKLLLVIYTHRVLKVPVQEYLSIRKYFFYNSLLVLSYLISDNTFY